MESFTHDHHELRVLTRSLYVLMYLFCFEHVGAC